MEKISKYQNLWLHVRKCEKKRWGLTGLKIVWRTESTDQSRLVVSSITRDLTRLTDGDPGEHPTTATEIHRHGWERRGDDEATLPSVPANTWIENFIHIPSLQRSYSQPCNPPSSSFSRLPCRILFAQQQLLPIIAAAATAFSLPCTHARTGVPVLACVPRQVSKDHVVPSFLLINNRKPANPLRSSVISAAAKLAHYTHVLYHDHLPLHRRHGRLCQNYCRRGRDGVSEWVSEWVVYVGRSEKWVAVCE